MSKKSNPKGTIRVGYTPDLIVLKGRFGEIISKVVPILYKDVPTIGGPIKPGYEPRYNKDSEIFEGSHHDYVIAINEIINPIGLRTAGAKEARVIQENIKELGLEECYVDFSKVIRGNNPWNHPWNHEVDLFPHTIDLSEFRYQRKESELVVTLKEDPKIMKRDIANINGEGDVEGLCLNLAGSLSSNWGGDRAFSFSAGRIVLVSGKPIQNFDDVYVPKLGKYLELLIDEQIT